MTKEYKMPEDILNYNDNWNTVRTYGGFSRLQPTATRRRETMVEMARLGVVPDRHETRTAFR